MSIYDSLRDYLKRVRVSGGPTHIHRNREDYWPATAKSRRTPAVVGEYDGNRAYAARGLASGGVRRISHRQFKASEICSHTLNETWRSAEGRKPMSQRKPGSAMTPSAGAQPLFHTHIRSRIP